MMEPNIELGEALFAQGRLDDAMACFQDLASKHPEDVRVLNDLAVVLSAGDRADEARDHLIRALAIEPGFLDARLNLAHYYLSREKWAEASRHLEEAHQAAPDELYILNLLVMAYQKQGRSKEAHELMEGSRGFQALKSLSDSFWLAVNYWEMIDGLPLKDRLEGVVCSCLSAIDGPSDSGISYRLVGDDPETGGPLVLEGLREAFYLKRPESMNLARLRDRDRPAEVLRVGDTEDWRRFVRLVKLEMAHEGGCLGDFTQSRKVLNREQAFSKYDAAETLRYFRESLGPCDCHAARGVEV